MLDRLENYRNQDGTYSPETPINLLKGIIPQDAVNYLSHLRWNDLAGVHYVLRITWENLNDADTERQEASRKTLENLSIQEPLFEGVFQEISDLLGTKYLQDDAEFRFGIVPPGMRAMPPNKKKKQ